MSKSDLSKEFDYYIRHQVSLCDQYEGKVIAIKDQAVIGAFDSESEAFDVVSAEHEPGSFLLQRVGKDQDSHTQNFRSRVAF